MKNRFENIYVHDISYVDMPDERFIGTFIVDPTDELIEIVDMIRQEKGYKDMSYMENDVYYNFYLDLDPKNMKIELYAACQHGIEDDELVYHIELNAIEEISLLYKVIGKFMCKEYLGVE